MRRSWLALWLALLVAFVGACAGETAETTSSTLPSTTESVSTSLEASTTTTLTTTTMASTTTIETTTTTVATTTTTPVSLTLDQIEARLVEEWPGTVPSTMWATPDRWTCKTMTSGTTLGKGSVAKCVPEERGEGQYPVLTVLVLDSKGTTAVSQAGVVYDVLNADWIVDTLGGDLFCRDILGESYLTETLPEADIEFFGAVLYWFMEGRPERMDADRNGIPCETLVPGDVVDSVWDGGWVEG